MTDEQWVKLNDTFHYESHYSEDNPYNRNQRYFNQSLNIQQVATAEVTKREKLLGWPDTAAYIPIEHKDKVWFVTAMAGTPSGDVGRVVSLLIGDGGEVLSYKRNWGGR